MNKTYIPALLLLALLAGIHFAAAEYHWYVRFYGTDVLMHILGGAGLACAIYWKLATFFPKYRPTFFTLVLLTIGAGLAWEVLEAFYNIAGAAVGTKAYYVDTIKDLCNDTIGALIAIYFIKKS